MSEFNTPAIADTEAEDEVEEKTRLENRKSDREWSIRALRFAGFLILVHFIAELLHWSINFQSIHIVDYSLLVLACLIPIGGLFKLAEGLLLISRNRAKHVNRKLNSIEDRLRVIEEILNRK